MSGVEPPSPLISLRGVDRKQIYLNVISNKRGWAVSELRNLSLILDGGPGDRLAMFRAWRSELTAHHRSVSVLRELNPYTQR
jgi:hypothetical protein